MGACTWYRGGSTRSALRDVREPPGVRAGEAQEEGGDSGKRKWSGGGARGRAAPRKVVREVREGRGDGSPRVGRGAAARGRAGAREPSCGMPACDRTRKRPDRGSGISCRLGGASVAGAIRGRDRA